LVEGVEEDHEREIKEERLEGLSKQAMEGINTISTSEALQAQILTRRRIEVAISEKSEEWMYVYNLQPMSDCKDKVEEPILTYQTDDAANLTPQAAEEEEISQPFPPVFHLPSLVISKPDQHPTTMPLCDSTEPSRQLIFGKRKPTRVPHSPLKHLRRITKLIKKE
jgi:hypothetical protein